MTPELVIFDCDGVIVDSEGMVHALLCDELAQCGLVLDVAHVHSLFVGGTIAGVAARAAEMGAIIPEGWVSRMYDRIYAALDRGVPLIPGIMDIMDRLDARKIPYCVGSNGRMAKMRISLGQHPALYARLVGRIFSAEFMAAPKPAPDLFLHAAQSMGHVPTACIVIEDSVTGIRAARAAGMRCLGFAPGSDGLHLRAEGAEIFHHMDDLPVLLGL